VSLSYQESETITGIGQRVRIIDSEPATQRFGRDLARNVAARPDVLHYELDCIADHTVDHGLF
jgi:hypothetical protein